MSYKRILTIQDISCFGQCSLTVALPIISACGIETAIIPSAVLSTHTGGFTGFTVRDLSEDIPGIADHWEREGIRFPGVFRYIEGYFDMALGCEIVDFCRTNLANHTENTHRVSQICIMQMKMGLSLQMGNTFTEVNR